MSVEETDRKPGGSVVHVDVRALPVGGDGNLYGGRAAQLAVVDRIALVKDAVVGAAAEFLRSIEPIDHVGCEPHVHPELVIARRVEDLASHRFDTLDEIEGVAIFRARLVSERRRDQRVGDRVERRLCRELQRRVVEGLGLKLLARQFVESPHPVGDELLPPRAEARVRAAELRRRGRLRVLIEPPLIRARRLPSP
jgi:hypothetical protein